MSHSASGRHRRQADPDRTPRAATLVAGALAALLVLTLAAWWFTGRAEDPEPGTVAPTSPGTTTSPSRSPGGSTVATERTVTVTGNRVVVEETSTVIDGGPVRATPTTASSTGLSLVGVSTVSADGRPAQFDTPVRLAASGSLTVRGRYRLTDCPDLLPVQWPSPSDFPDATRTYLTLDEPLRTSYALCPNQRSHASAPKGLSGRVVAASTPTVRLAWAGERKLQVETIGSASGVAAVAVEPGCGGVCAVEIDAGSEAALTLQPVDPCPPATDNDRLTLRLGTGKVVAVTVPGLHRVVCV